MNFVIVLFFVLLSLISYSVLLYSSYTYYMAADYTFFFYKVGLVLATIGMGYFATLFGTFHEYFPKLYGRVAIVQLYKVLAYLDYPLTIL